MLRALWPSLVLAAGCAAGSRDGGAPPEPLPGFFGSPLAPRDPEDADKNQLFGAWGDANVFDLDGRRLALCVRTVRKVEGNPPLARLENQIGVYDITGDRQTSGRRFRLDGAASTSFNVADRDYVLKFARRGPDTAITLSASSENPPVFGYPGQTRLPTVNELFRMRAQAALASSRVETIDGARYRVTAESASVASLLFWSESRLLADGDPRWLVPDLLAEVVKTEAGATRRLGDLSPFCRLIRGRWWGLRWNPATLSWELGAGDEFRPTSGSAASGTLRMEVPSTREGKHHFVTVTVVGPGLSRADVRCLVDTGASALSLPLSLAARLGFKERDFQDVAVLTANGKVTRKAATLRAVEISGKGGRDTIHDVPVVFGAEDMPLLGMSVLGHYRLILEDGKDEIVLERQR
jgi:clan AA aspartic protease (TIGR02281 family)